MTALPANLFKNHSEIKHLYENLAKVGDDHNEESINKAVEVIHSWLKENGYSCEVFAISLQDSEPDVHHIRYFSHNNDISYPANFQDKILPWFSSENKDTLLHIEKLELGDFLDKLAKINSLKISSSEQGKVVIVTLKLSCGTIDLIYVFPQLKDLTEDEAENLISISFILGTYFTSIIETNRFKKELEEKEKVSSKIIKIEQQKEEFVSMAAHELRSPLAAIKGYLSMVIEGDAGPISDKARGFLADANSINERIIRLVNNMLNASRIEEGRLAYQMEYEYLSNVVKLVFHQFIPEAERKGLRLELKVPHEIRDRVYIDIDKTTEVIGNLVSNAVKYTDQGSVIVRLTQPDKNTVRFEVEDTGPGITKAEQDKLFRKFYRVESNVGKTTGTGLGLYISKLLIEKFGGKIGLISDFGKGCTFWFEVPLSYEES
jgi:signal transduction histidine kinase